ncbi:P27 family phage terminase small subunit [Sulfuricurvum sp.]|uniref:P27 family phage terminase small subunit n=1 Tax=Sulfuricurvum sp. TaxID=2025608 RepID=UPI003BB1700C
MATRTIDWDNIKIDWLGRKFASVSALASHYGLSRQAISKKAKKEEWGDFVPLSKKAPVATTPDSVTDPHDKILGPIAMRKIEELKKELGENYSHVDEPLIVCYAKAYERYIDLEVQMSTQNVVSTSTKGGKYLNPLFNAIQMTQKTLVTIGGQLGLSIYSRKKMGIKLGEETEKGGGLFDFADDINKLVGTVNA